MVGMPKAFLFDLDGTLIDSMPHHHDAWIEWHAEHAIAFDAATFFAMTAGRTNAEILADLMPTLDRVEHLRMADEKEAIYRRRAGASLELIAGARAFAAAAREAGLKLAVCTASTPLNMALAFDRFGIDAWVDTIVSPADGLRGKPHPDIFVEAARRLGIAPDDCIVFEDAPLGLEAARRAGMPAVALTTTLPADAFAGYSNLRAIGSDFLAPAVAGLLPVPIGKAPHDA
ncbi:MAG: HAD family phosphatase [Proteobacteria bacterium]|nr:HAD family phosphatase [Pseudomonadota bacterium]